MPDLEEAGGDAIFPALFPSPAAGLFTAKGDGKRMAWGFQLPSAGGLITLTYEASYCCTV
jgi:hypothetical protein